MRELNDLIPEYIEESREYLKNIEEDTTLMKQGTHNYELIDRISRVVRSIKGGASFLGLKNIEQLSRKIEEVFNQVRNRDIELSSQTASCILNAIDMLNEILENAGTNVDLDINAHLLELDVCLLGKPPSASHQPVNSEDVDSAFMLDECTFEALKKQNKKIFHLQFELRELQYRNYSSPLEFFREIEKTGEIIELKVDMELVLENDSFTGEGIPLSLIYATGLEREIVAYIFDIDENQVIELENIVNCEKKRQTSEEMQSIEWIEENDEERNEENKVTGDNDEIKDKNEYLTFLVGNEEYGIHTTQVVDIITFQEITMLPGAEDFTRGIIHFRSDIIPVYDFRLRLKFEKKEYDRETVILIVTVGEKKVGIIVDRVSEMIRLTQDQITEAPPIQRIPSGYIIGIGQKEGRFVVLLKISTIFKIDLEEEKIS